MESGSTPFGVTPLLPSANEVWGKVRFSQTSVGPWGSLSRGGFLYLEGSLSRVAPVKGVSVQGVPLSREGLCPGGCLSQGGSLSRPWGSLSGRFPPNMVENGQYTSYWNTFWFCNKNSITIIIASLSQH